MQSYELYEILHLHTSKRAAQLKKIYMKTFERAVFHNGIIIGMVQRAGR